MLLVCKIMVMFHRVAYILHQIQRSINFSNSAIRLGCCIHNIKCQYVLYHHFLSSETNFPIDSTAAHMSVGELLRLAGRMIIIRWQQRPSALRPNPGVAGFAALCPGASAPGCQKNWFFYEAEAGPQGGTHPPGGPPPPPPFPSNPLGASATNHGTPCVREPGGWPSTLDSMCAALVQVVASIRSQKTCLLMYNCSGKTGLRIQKLGESKVCELASRLGQLPT